MDYHKLKGLFPKSKGVFAKLDKINWYMKKQQKLKNELKKLKNNKSKQENIKLKIELIRNKIKENKISEKDIDPKNILAITFTKNAANEMIDRLISLSDKNNAYQKLISDKTLTREQKNQKRREHVKKYPWLSNISLKTFHGLCNQILRIRGDKEFDTKYRILTDNRYDAEIESKQIARETPEQIINKIINNLCEDPEYLLTLKRYVLDYYVDEYNVKLHKKDYFRMRNHLLH